MKELIAGKALLDAFRLKHPRVKEFTFNRPGSSSSRIDRIYLSPQLCNDFSVSHVPSLSDHCSVLLKINLKVIINRASSKSATYWKLNNSVLEEEEFLPSFKHLWLELAESKSLYPDLAEWWDKLVKPKVKQFCIMFSRHIRSVRSDTTRFLLSYLKLVLAEKNWEEVSRVKGELHTIAFKNSMGLKIRSKCQQNSEEEKASIYHAAREARSNKNNITALKIEGSVVKDAVKIENTVTSFFHALFNGYHNSTLEDTGTSFQPDYSNLDKFLHNISALSEPESESLNSEINLEELDQVLKSCKNNKSPGLDGLTYEFYKKVWPLIKHDFVKILQCQLDRACMIESNKIGATRLAPKVSGVPQVDELRPITLLNTDYKLLSKLLVRRVKPVLPTVVRSSQLCTVSGKNILFGINNIISSIFHVKDKKKHGCILSLDFFKAYDRVLLDYLLKVMRKMNFSVQFCNWIRMMHDGAKTQFILTHLSVAIEVSFSIRQGDPLAMILYILYIEPLLLYLEQSLTGLQVAGIGQVLEAYCDDVNIMTDNLEDLSLVDTVVKEFEIISGAILSRGMKCKIFGFGKWKGKNVWPLDYILTENEIKIFGIFIKDSYRSLIKRNWDYRIGKLSSCLKAWSSRYLPSLGSKIQVVKTFALSRIYYVAAILPVYASVVQKIESLVGNFIWKSSGWVLRVALSEMQNELKRGGLNLVSVTAMCNSLLLSQFLRLLKSSYHKALSHVDSWIGDILSDLLPDFGLYNQPLNVPEYFCHLESLVVVGRIDDMLTTYKWRQVTNKVLYHEQRKNFPDVKVQIEAGSSLNFDVAWSRISLPVLSSSVRDVSYLLLHNKLPTKERLHRVGLSGDPFCLACPGSPVHDIEHCFCLCIRVKDVWSHIRDILIGLVGEDIPNDKLIRYNMPKSSKEIEAVWLLGNYISESWRRLSSGYPFLRGSEFFGYLRFKFKDDQVGARVKMSDILGL